MPLRVSVVVFFLFALTRCINGGSSHLLEVVHPLHRFNKRLGHSVRHLSPRRGSRSLLQVDECEWNDEDSVCEGALPAAIPILNESDNPVAQFFGTLFECYVQLDEESCNAVGFCFWDSADEICDFSDYAVSNPDSPCVQNAPATLDLFVAVQVCPAEITEAECEAIGSCEWDLEIGICDPDTFRIFFGVSQFELREAVQPLVNELFVAGISAFEEEFDTSDPDFDWTNALEFEIPAVDCPEDTDPTLCEYADAIARGFLPTHLYCNGQYSDPEECNSDPLCEVDPEDDSCTYAESVADDAAIDAILVLIDVIPNETDRDFLTAGVVCGRADEDSCTDASELCVWNPIFSWCEVSVTGIFQALADSGDDPSDGVCAFFSLYAESGCESIFDEETCLANDQCIFEDDCGTDGENVILAIFEDDPEVEEQINAVEERCGEFLTQDECEA